MSILCESRYNDFVKITMVCILPVFIALLGESPCPNFVMLFSTQKNKTLAISH